MPNRKVLLGTCASLVLAFSPVFAMGGKRAPSAPCCPPVCPHAPVVPPGTAPPPGTVVPPVPVPDPGAAPVFDDAFTEAPQAGTGAPGSFNPNMFGDQGGSAVCGPVILTFPNGTNQRLSPGQSGVQVTAGTTINENLFVQSLSTGARRFIPAGQPLTAADAMDINGAGGAAVLTDRAACGVIPPSARGSFKITENESPRPQDRVFGTYNYFYNVNGSLNAPGVPRTDIHRGVIGFEKTFLDGDASFGVRLPYLSVQGDGSISQDDLADLTLILKLALINDRDTGNVISCGLVVTPPTGESFLPAGLDVIHPTLIQPYVGGIYNSGNFFVQGFSSIVVPTDDRDVTYFFNDVGVGYNIFLGQDDCGECESRLLTSITPIFEVHINTPLNNRGALNEPIGGFDIVDLTGGATLGFGGGSTLNVGIVTPVTGPKPFDVEALVQFTLAF